MTLSRDYAWGVGLLALYGLLMLVLALEEALHRAVRWWSDGNGVRRWE